MATTATHSGLATFGLVAGPLLLVAAVAAALASALLGTIGPFDRTQVGWFCVPAGLLAPGVLGLAWRAPGGARLGGRVLALTAGGFGLFLVVGLMATVTWVNCRPISGPLDVVPGALLMGAVVALAFAGATLVAARIAGHAIFALLAGSVAAAIGYFIAIFIFVLFAFPVVSCSAP